MELNREQIIKALECHADDQYCVECPYTDNRECHIKISQNALALIKELTEENERLTNRNNFLEIELKNQSNLFVARVNSVRADTVRKMQERLNAHFDSNSDYFRSSHGYIRDVTDKIATEILEGNHDTKNN